MATIVMNKGSVFQFTREIGNGHAGPIARAVMDASTARGGLHDAAEACHEWAGNNSIGRLAQVAVRRYVESANI